MKRVPYAPFLLALTASMFATSVHAAPPDSGKWQARRPGSLPRPSRACRPPWRKTWRTSTISTSASTRTNGVRFTYRNVERLSARRCAGCTSAKKPT